MVAVVGCASAPCSTGVVADRPGRPVVDYSEILVRAPDRVPDLSGCYELGAELVLESGEVGVPREFELLEERFTELGHHHIGRYRTTMPRVTQSDKYQPTWIPVADDEIQIDLDPGLGPLYLPPVYAKVFGDSVRLEIRDEGYLYPPEFLADTIWYSEVASEVRGVRVNCDHVDDIRELDIT